MLNQSIHNRSHHPYEPDFLLIVPQNLKQGKGKVPSSDCIGHVGESSDTFPWSDVLQECRLLFKRKLHDRFPSAVKLNPLRERIVARLSE